MASTIALLNVTDCIEVTSPVLDKVSRKKRKFRADIPQSDLLKNDSLFESYLPHRFSDEEHEGIPSHCEKGACNVYSDCDLVSAELKLGLPGIIKKEPSPCILERSEWDDSAESELRELVLSVLDATLKSAIKKIVDCGYPEKVAVKAMMRPGIYYGSKDTLSNIVDNSLAYLQTSQDLKRSERYRFKDLDELKDYLLAEFVYALQVVRPIFSPAEALWYLLFFDIDVSHACFVIGGQYKPVEDEYTSEGSSKATQNQLNTQSKTLDMNHPTSSADIQSEMAVHLIKEPEIFRFTAHDTKDSNAGTPQKFVAEGTSRTHFLSSLKNVATLERKWKYADIGRRKCGLKGAHKTRRIRSWNSVRVKQSNCNRLPLPGVICSPFSIATEIDQSFYHGLTKEPIQASVTGHSDVNIFKYNECSIQEIIGQPDRRDLESEIIFHLTARSQIWQNNLKEWTEWANTKILQATRRLLKNKPELNKLRQEKLETDRLEQERKSLKENITKKLSELENAVYKTSGKVNSTNSAIRRLETENATLRQEMEVAQFQATKSAANCQEAFARERERLITVQTYIKQKGFLQDDLNAEKVKHAEAQQEFNKATCGLRRLEAKLSKDAKAKEELVRQATSVRKEIEHLVALGKSKEEAINSKTVSTLQKYEDSVQELQKEISKLRLKSDSSAIALLKRGTDENHVTTTTGLRKYQIDRKPQNSSMAKNAQVSYAAISKALVARHRECVMCLEEEMSVVFLPCAHQVLCTKCNGQHKKSGMKDCPSCRSTILQRIPVRYANP